MERKKITKEVFDAFAQLRTNPIDFINSTTFKTKSLNLNSRLANHWAEKGLFTRKYETGSWFVFNLTESFWILIIKKLRDFKIPLEVIKKIKDSFFTEPERLQVEDVKSRVLKELKESGILNEEQMKIAENGSIWERIQKIELNYFEKVMISILLERRPYFIIVNLNGEAILVDESRLLLETDREFLNAYKEITSRSHIKIYMNEILGDLVKTLGELTCSQMIPILTKNESEIIKHLRGKNISKVEIRYGNSVEPEMIEITSNNLLTENIRLHDIIISKGYQNITIKTQNGKVVHSENTIKHKLDTE